MNPFNTTSNTFTGYDTEPLGWSANNPASPDQTLPALAQSWSLSRDGTALTVHLQPSARWSDGRPVTAADVKVSAAIWFAQSAVRQYNLGTVTVTGNKTVRFTQVPGAHNDQFEPGVLQPPDYIVPASVYGGLLPPDIWRIIGTSLGTGPAAAAAVSKLTDVGKHVAAFAPAEDVSAGPFVIKRINAGEALLVKNQYFYAADKIIPSQVVMLHYSDNQQIWSYLQAGRLDAAPYTAMPTSVLQRVQAAGNIRLQFPSLVAAALAFDQASYPYGILAVRQALAYLIDRGAVQEVAEPVSGTPSVTTTGVVASALSGYVPPGQGAALIPYRADRARAASLLRSAGFDEKGSQWRLPGGKPWTVEISVPAGFSDWIEAASVIKAELDEFGIPASVNLAPDYPTYQARQNQGKYPVSFFLIGFGPSAYGTFSSIYGSYDGYVPTGGTLHRYPSGNPAADNFLNAPATVTVPGSGSLDPGQLTYELAEIDPSTAAGLRRQDAIMAELVAATNHSLPVLQLWDYVNVQFANGRRFADWPSGNDALLNQSPGVWMTYGYVRPR
jgi:peptide/nickel transport system substrate-binding protein